MKKLFWLVILPLFFINCGGNSYVNVVSYKGMWGAVSDNKVQFYAYEDRVWQIKPDFEFTLPKGYKSIFISYDYNYDNMIGVNFNDKVQFYRYSEKNEWQIVPEYELKLPKFTKNVFYSYYDDGTTKIEIGIIVNNKVQFFQYIDNWEVFTDMEFIIPDEYKNITDGLYIYFNTFDHYDKYGFVDDDYDKNEFYYIGSTVGLISENKMQFFGLGIYPSEDEDENKMDYIWKVVPELEFALPKGYKNIFLPDTIDLCVGIVFNNNIQFYTFDNKKGWITKEFIDFTF